MAPAGVPATATRGHRVAVLPLTNISPNANDAYFADGMTEEIVSTPSKMRA